VPGNSIDHLVAANVRAEMARQQYTQTSFAKKLGRTQQALSQRLCGRVPFDVAELNRIAEILGVPLADLLPEQAAS